MPLLPLQLPPPQLIASQYAKLARPQNVLYPGFLSAFIGYTVTESVGTAAACYVFFFAAYSIAAGYNNMIDRETDRLNNRHDNPLLAIAPSSGLSQRSVQIFFLLNFAIIGLVQIFLNQPASLWITVVYMMLIFGYSQSRISLQSRGWTAAIVLAACYGGLPILLGLAQSTSGLAQYPLMTIMALFSLQILLLVPILLAKDYKDLHGDALTGKRTPLVRYGSRVVTATALSIAFAAAVTYTILGIYVGVNTYIIACTTIVYLAFCYRLHTTRGVVGAYLRKFAMAVLLVASVALVYAALHLVQ